MCAQHNWIPAEAPTHCVGGVDQAVVLSWSSDSFSSSLKLLAEVFLVAPGMRSLLSPCWLSAKGVFCCSRGHLHSLPCGLLHLS